VNTTDPHQRITKFLDDNRHYQCSFTQMFYLPQNLWS